MLYRLRKWTEIDKIWENICVYKKYINLVNENFSVYMGSWVKKTMILRQLSIISIFKRLEHENGLNG